MAARTLQPSALKAQLQGLSRQIQEAVLPIVAFQATGWDGPATVDVDGRSWQVAVCRSVLEVREALALRADVDQALVILTDVRNTELLPDVTARFVKRRVLEVDAWEPVLRAFGAQRIDGRLTRHKWMPDVLLAGAPVTSYPKVASGTLDVTTAWRWVARVLLGVDAEDVDARTVLEWTLDPAVLGRWSALPHEQSSELASWLQGAIGAAVELPLALIRGGHGADALPVGLVCAVLFDGPGEPAGVRGAAAVRLERWTGGTAVAPARGQMLAATAESLMTGMRAAGDERVAGLLARADELLRDLGAETEAWRSRWLPSAFHQRLDRFAQALTAARQDRDVAAAMARAADAQRALREHAAAADDPERVSRAAHALRLVRYLRTRSTEPATSFPHAVRTYLADDAFADVARHRLYASEPHQAFGAALAAVADAVAAAREERVLEFARLAAGWFEAPSDAEGLVPVEQVVTSVVAPLAAQGPVLLLVIDGMNAVAAESLAESVARRGWSQVARVDGPERLAALPALPSVTEVCRTSLFCGALRKGTATDERAGFAAHPALLPHSKPAFPPVVFHKASLGAAAELDGVVAAAIANPDQRVVAAVVNAVDDHLMKDDMVRPTWTTEYVPVIGALCDAARASGRRLIVTADHGHVLDLKLTEKTAGDGADRYRLVTSPERPGEVLVTGSRVLADGGRVVVAASERLRYSARKNGYHGGISPQEMVVPLLVFSIEGAPPKGYREIASVRPAWWDVDVPMGAAAEAPPKPRKTGLPLFDTPADRPIPATAVVPATRARWWVEPLLASEVLKEQRSRAARVAVTDERLRALLAAVASRGGRMTVAAVAERLGMPAGRVTSTVAAVAQMLNFDGYQVLFVEGEEVVLNETLLVTQFELERGA